MAAVLGGLGAAVIWAIGTAFSSRAARRLGPALTLAWVMLVGLLGLSLVLPWSGSPRFSAATGGWLVLAGAGNVGGLVLLYQALRIGQLGVVMPIAATEGGIAALLSILAGQPVTALAAAALATTVVGVVMTALTRRRPATAAAGVEFETGTVTQTRTVTQTHTMTQSGTVTPPQGHRDRRAAAWAVAGAMVFGVSLYATGKAGSVLPAAWAVLPPRVIGVVGVALPLALRGRLRCSRGAFGLVLAAGLCEVGGFFVYALGARDNIAVAAVLATLTGAISAGFGRLLYQERLAATQVVGVVVVLAGVATLSALNS